LFLDYSPLPSALVRDDSFGAGSDHAPASMPLKTSPPPTPVSSPRVSPTPPGSPTNSETIDNNFVGTHHQQQSPLGLSPSNIPLTPVHPPDNASSLNVINVDPAPSSHHQLLSGADDMDIDDTTGLSPNGSPVRSGTGVGNTSIGSDDGSGAGSEPDWSADDWMVDMRRVKARLLLPVVALSNFSARLGL
jgi:hypothetical protein